jgi:lauroyl/myristoyl acyltransferase
MPMPMPMVVWARLLPDQVPPEGQGVWVPFFGRPA